MRAADPNATYRHIFDEDKALPPEQQTVFPLSNLTVQERAFLRNLKGAEGTIILYALHLGLGAPENFRDQAGNPIVFQRDDKAPVILGNKRPWKEECLGYLLPETQEKLSELILKGVDDGIQGAVAKNS
jgi:hypothetical protein